MLIRIACPSCGDDGEDVAGAEGNVVACPSCGTRLVLAPLDVEDAAASWVGSPALASIPPTTSEDGTCVACGYEGPMLVDASLGYPECPACGASQRDRTIGRVQRIDCPECTEPIDAERGKTVVCPHCRSFLGCLVPEEPRSRWWRRGG